MGVWGTGIFSNDDASDLREDYRTLLGDGVSGPEATEKLLQEWRPSSETDPYNAATFWLALAVSQWKSGRLEGRVKREAIQVIENGAALQPWKGGKLEGKRAAVLEATRKLLNDPQPAARKITKVFRATCDWQPGELIAYQLRSGSFIVFQVIELHTDKGGVAPVCELFDWQGASAPSAEMLSNCGMRAQIPLIFKNSPTPLPQTPPRYRLMIGQCSKREFPKTRVLRLHAQLPIQHPLVPKNTPNPTLVCLWRSLDETLQRHYGLN